MNFLKPLLLFAAIFCCSYCQGQTIDSVYVDTTLAPSPTYIRFKFPHSGFQLTDCFYYYPASYPPQVQAKFAFKECIGTLGTSYFDTTINLYVDPQIGRVMIVLYLQENTTDSSCVLRAGTTAVDFLYKDFALSQSVNNAEVSSYSIYPNPVVNHHLFVEGNNSTLLTATLYNLQGSTLTTYLLNSKKAEINLPDYLPPNNYLLQLRTGNGEVIRKLITVQ